MLNSTYGYKVLNYQSPSQNFREKIRLFLDIKFIYPKAKKYSKYLKNEVDDVIQSLPL